jgi:ribonuclease HI
MALGSSLRCTSECLQFTCDTIDTDSKAVTKECVDKLMREGGGVVVGGGGAEGRRKVRGQVRGWTGFGWKEVSPRTRQPKPSKWWKQSRN